MKRWLKAAGPPAVAAALVVTTLIMHAVQQPDPSDPSYLSPTSAAGDGAADLAGRLRERGVTIERRTSTPDAIATAVGSRNATLFIPAPEMVRPQYLRDLLIIPPSTRIVLVTPNRSVLGRLDLALPQAGPRWTAAAPAPGCNASFATGRAAVLRFRYDAGPGQTERCYDGGLVELDRGGPAVTLVGAPDAFRNDRQDEWANAEFAAGLLGRGASVVWLDLHEPEPPDPDPPVGREEDPVGEDEQGSSGEEGGDGDEQTEAREDDQTPAESQEEQREQENPLFDAFPPSFWAAVLLLLLAAVAFAAASARRLGAPVAEPLPARVRAAETVRGLGGLYRRAKARDASLTTVQAAAVRRLAAHFGVPADLESVCAKLDLPPHEARALLGGGVEDTDEDLVAKAADVQRLVRRIVGPKGEQ